MLEAMASGAAVIATDTAGARELVRDPDMLVPVRDPVALAEKISELIRDSERRRSVAAEAEHYARENFSLERMMDETEGLYRRLLN